LTLGALLVAVLAVPLLAAAVSWSAAGDRRIAGAATVASGVATFGLSLALVPAVGERNGHAVAAFGGWLRADPLSLVFFIATAFLYCVTAVFVWGYVAADPTAGTLYRRRLFAGLNIFAWAMAMAPLVNNLGLLWVAIEVTTVVSALLVAAELTISAIEAAWKYLVLASLGLGLSLLATALVYHAGSFSLGQSYELAYTKLLGRASHFPSGSVRLAYLLAVVGFGTKMGLFPVHTWLPDAHSEAPTPVSALLSGSLLATCFYAILRYYQVAQRSAGAPFARGVLAGFGVATLVLGALYVASQRDLKRLLAYSSIEHMGILAIGVSFASPLALVGALLHVLAHAAAKGTSFFGAGSVVRKLRTKDLDKLHGGVGLLPWTGPMLVAGMLGLSALPPFGTFRSELSIVAGGLASRSAGGSGAARSLAAVLVVLVTLAFLGFSWHITKSMLSPSETGVPAAGEGARSGWLRATREEPSRMIALAMVLGLAGLVLLGVHPPAQLDHLLRRAAAELEVPR
jgi:hydrogenase-4 component F